MPQLLREDFADKWIPLLADNVFMNIDGPLLERLIVDIKDSFAASTLTANVPDWVKDTYYPQGFVILHRFVPGPDIFLKANQEGYLDEPTVAVGDANWSPALSPAPDNALYQVGTVEALRRARVNWQTGRLYVLIGRVDPATGEALPDVYVRALSATQLEPEAWLFDESAIGAEPVRIRYNLDRDETQPVVVDAYTKDEANDRFGTRATQQQHAYRLGVVEGVQDARILVKTLDGYVNVWATMPTFIPAGSVVTVHGAFSFPALDYKFPASGTLVLAPGSSLTLQNFRPPNNFFLLCGEGTLNAPVSIAPDALQVTIRDITLNGYLYAFSYNLSAGATRSLRLQNVRLTNADSSQAAITIDYGNGGFYHTYLQLEASGCDITSASDAIKFFDQIPSYAATDAQARATNSLLLLQNRIRVAAGKQVLNDADGALSFVRGGNLYLDAPVPKQASRVVGHDGGDVYTSLAYVTNLVLDCSRVAQLLKLAGDLSVTGTFNRAQGKELRLHLLNSTASTANLSWPSSWAWRGVVPASLAAGKQATLSLECAWGGAETDIIAAFSAQL